MPEMTIIVDEREGALAIEDDSRLSAAARLILGEQFGEAREIGCAKPLAIITTEPASAEELETAVCVRVGGFYHNSLTEGPGRRSSVLFQSCPLKCKGCWVTHLHSEDAGELVPVTRLAAKLLDPKYERDGVSILGGEPFAQPEGLLALIRELRGRGCQHILCYSGYTLETLNEKAARQPSIGAILDEIEVLIDGAFVESKAAGAGLWTGSGNQRVIDLRMSAKRGEIVLFTER